MLPGKIFLESIKLQNEHAVVNKSTYKLNLVLNNIYYDDLKQFHTKYLCVNSTDVLTIELFAIEPSQLLGVAVISQVYKHIIDNRTIQIKVKSKDKSNQDLSVKISFQPVLAFNKNATLVSNRLPDEIYNRSPSPPKAKQFTNQGQLSFSNKRNGNDYFNETLGNNNSGSFLQTSRTPVEGSSLMKEGEGESLQSLAQQRQKILGQLFGKFKRQR